MVAHLRKAAWGMVAADKYVQFYKRMTERKTELAPKYVKAVEHWRQHNFPDFPYLEKVWDRHFPKDTPFCLCAKFEVGMPETVPVGEHTGEVKKETPAELEAATAKRLLEMIKAQASTEFGSIQQHQMTLERADNEQDRVWMLRVMAEELRHGYQMLTLLTQADWSSAGQPVRSEDLVEDILSMRTGSHVLAAFNVEYDSFLDNIVFAALIDRVGKYQLSMQKACLYKPMADSMPPMLKEEAFHLAAGVLPLRRWAQKAGEGTSLVDMHTVQQAINKWFPRALEMFGHEQGGADNIAMGLKDMDNATAQEQYVQELEKLITDLNRRFLRARYKEEGTKEIDRRIAAPNPELLVLPARQFFRRRGEGAFSLIRTDGTAAPDYETFVSHVRAALPTAYLASKDVAFYLENVRQVQEQILTVAAAVKRQPFLQRGLGNCPCSSSVKWVVDETTPTSPI